MNRRSLRLALTFLTALVIAAPFTGWLNALIIAVVGSLYIFLTESAGRFPRARLKFLSLSTPSPHIEAKSALIIPKSWFKRAAATNFTSPEKRPLVMLGGIIAAAALPLILNRYQTEVVTLGLLYVTLALGLNYIVGLCGLLALGYIAFYAIGAYTYALLNTKLGLNFFLCWPLGALTGAAAGALVGLPVLRLRGDYLAIVTLGFGEITRIILNNWDSFTAGPNGIMGIARPTLFGWRVGTPDGYYYLALGLGLLAVLVQSRIIASRIGRAWEAIREDELAAAHVGVPLFRMKLWAMALGGAWAGAAGVLFAARMTHVSPESFTFLESVLVLCMVVLGGMGSIAGVAVGALALIILPELLRGVAAYRMLAFGLLLVLAMRFRRGGFIVSRRLRI